MIKKNENEHSKIQIPAKYFFFPAIIFFIIFVIFGKTGFYLVADYLDPSLGYPPVNPLTFFDKIVYYILTYFIMWPILGFSLCYYNKKLTSISKLTMNKSIKLIVLALFICAFFFYLWTEAIFGVDAPYNHSWDLQFGCLHVYAGDMLASFGFYACTAATFLLIFYFHVNYDDWLGRRALFMISGVLLQAAFLQDWFWFVFNNSYYLLPGDNYGVYFNWWIPIPFTSIWIPGFYLIIALIGILIWSFSIVKEYPFTQIKWILIPFFLVIILGIFLGFMLHF